MAQGKRKTPARKSPAKKAARNMDALALLKQDHAKVQEMFERFEKSRKAELKQKLAESICMELEVHARIEEEIFYPAMREALKDEDLLDEAQVEHQSAKELMAKIRGAGAQAPLFEALVKVLGEYVRHHVREEEKEMFPQAKRSKADLKALGEQLAARKAELMQA
jgi:hemerythrin superfamily protein